MNAHEALANAKRADPSASHFLVRVYDGFDNCWSNCGPPMTGEEAMELWNQRTENGTRSTSYSNIDYYAIFPTTVKMVHSEEGNRELGINTIR